MSPEFLPPDQHEGHNCQQHRGDLSGPDSGVVSREHLVELRAREGQEQHRLFLPLDKPQPMILIKGSELMQHDQRLQIERLSRLENVTGGRAVAHTRRLT